MLKIRAGLHQLRRSSSAAAAHKRYQDKVVIVTGSAKGIGKGIAQAFANAGSQVIVSDMNADAGQAAVADIHSHGGKAHFIQCDVTSKSDMERLIAETTSTYNQLDCVVNNAGQHPPHYPIEGFTEQDCMHLFQINVLSVFTMCRLAMPHLRRTQGNIINVSSMVAEQGQLGASTYAASKGAVTSMSKALAVDEAKHNVRINILSPGNIWTPLWEAACPNDPEELRKAYKDGTRQQVLGRFGTPEEAGAMALFMAAEATFSTGQNFYLTGGTEIGYGYKLATEGSDL
eukprot:TRINITY_DN10_c0_g1_i1.p1 TRINITY_DN10_c0_g1~~TRINITY_DN10_c0_g1_i1.p1  ORF type:complete len:287 (+),score=68.05 TRINITY_DN10_c0_g1_i1:57-917(+)